MNFKFCFLFFLFAWGSLFACSCIGETSVKDGLKESSVVFVGRVVSQEEITIPYKLSGTQTIIKYHYYKVILKVQKVYKGKVKEDTVEIITGIGNGDCGYSFETNKDYVVYSKFKDRYFNGGNKVSKFLYTDICTRTTSKVAEEEDNIKKYRKP